MQFHKAGNVFFCTTERSDRDYIRRIAERVYARYDGSGPRWSLSKSNQMWPISFGERAGVLGIKIDDRMSCVKLFYDERTRTKLRVALGASKGRRAYRNGVRLAEAGIPCPGMLGYAERRPFGPAMIVTELVAGGVRLDLWARKHPIPRETLTNLAHFVRSLHDRGVSHADLSPRNILLTRCDPSGGLALLDYEDTRFHRKVGRRRRLNNLHHLHERVIGYVPLRSRLRFLHAYTEQDYPFWRDTLRRMIEKTNFRWLRTHAGVNTTSIPSQGNA